MYYPNFLLKINISNAILGCIWITKYLTPLRAARANPVSVVVLAHPQLQDFVERYENKNQKFECKFVVLHFSASAQLSVSVVKGRTSLFLRFGPSVNPSLIQNALLLPSSLFLTFFFYLLTSSFLLYIQSPYYSRFPCLPAHLTCVVQLLSRALSSLLKHTYIFFKNFLRMLSHKWQILRPST